MIRKLATILLALLVLLPTDARAQRIYPADTTSAFKATQLIAPGVLIGSGLAVHFFAHESWEVPIRNQMLEWSKGAPDSPIDNYIQYLPLAMDLGLGFTGMRVQHCFVDRSIEAALGYAAAGIISWSGKLLFQSLRPNDANRFSFPSGHCTTVFTGAELVRKEYGWGWGAGAYCVAATVAFMRMYRDWHWFGDVLAGAGVGILSANIGCWLLEPTKKLLGIKLPEKWQFGVVPAVDPVSGVYCASFAMKF